MLPLSLSNFADRNTQLMAAELFQSFINKYGQQNIGKCIALTRKVLNQKGFPMEELQKPTPLKTLPVDSFTKTAPEEKIQQPEHSSLFGDLKYY